MKNIVWCFMAFAVLMIGCWANTDNPGPGPQVTSLACFTGGYIDVNIDYQYMYRPDFGNIDSFYTLYGDDFNNFKNAYQRAHIYIYVNTGFPNTSGQRCNWKTLYADQRTTMDTYTWQTRTYNQGAKFFLCTIDKFGIDTQPDRLGFTRWYLDSLSSRRGYSYVFAGKISDYPSIVQVDRYKAYATTHELGHAIGLIHGDGTGDTGSNASTCLMRYADPTASIAPIRDNFNFCDAHLCSLYNFATLNTSLVGTPGGHSNINLQQENLTYTISLNKNEYEEFEPIVATLTVENTGNKRDSVSFNYFEDFLNHLDLMNSKNKGPTGFHDISDFFKVPYTKLMPGEKITLSKKLQENYGYVNVNDFLYFNEDTYTVQYYNDERKGLSNKVVFKVHKPQDMDSVVANEFINIVKMQVFDFNRPQGERLITSLVEAKFEAIKKLMTDYPPNGLTEEIYNFYNLTYGNLGMKEDIIDRNMWFINSYPNSFYVQDIMYRTMHASYHFRNGDSSAFDLLDSIIKAHPGTYAEKVAEQLKKTKQYQK